MDNQKYFCIFGGGAIRGLCYAGVLKALTEKQIDIVGYAGSSAGSIAAVLAALNYSYNEICDILSKFDYTLFLDINISLKLEFAISKGEVFTDKIRKIIQKKLNTNKPVTFKDFPEKLYIIASNLSTGKSVIFSQETTPDFEVAQAIRISSGFPGLMNPYEYNGEQLVDGDLAKAYAISQISPLLDPKDIRVLEFRLEGEKSPEQSKNVIEFMNTAFDFFSSSATDNIIKLFAYKDKYDFIVINTEDTLLFNFNLSSEQKDYLINLGYLKTKSFFEKSLPIKRKCLLIYYEKLLKVLNSAIEYLNKNNYGKYKDVLFSYIAEYYSFFEILDQNIITELNECVKITNANFEKLLFIKSHIRNKNSLSDKLLKIQEKLNAKIKSLELFLKV